MKFAFLLLQGACTLLASSLYVSNQVTGLVSYYDPVSGGFQGSFGVYRTPVGLLALPAGELFIAAFGEDKVYKLDTLGGGQSVFATLPDGSGPFGAAADALGNIYITTSRSGRVFKFDPNGVPLGSVAVPFAKGISYNPVDDNLYVAVTSFNSANNSVVRVTTSLTVSPFASSNLSSPVFTLADSSGRVLVSNGAVAGSIVAFQLNGTFDGTIQSGLFAPNQIAADGATLYIALFGNSDVLACSGPGVCPTLVDQGSGRGVSGLAFAPLLTPEPSSWCLFAIGCALAARARRRRVRTP